MNAALLWRAEFYDPAAPDKVLGHVDGDSRAVAQAEPPHGAQARFRLLTPPDIRLGDHVSYDNGDDAPFQAIVTRVGSPYPSGTYNVDLSRDGATQTVFCENCTVVFRPRHHAWRVDEVIALLVKAAGEAVRLGGGNPQKTAKLLKVADGTWTLTCWAGEDRVDSRTYTDRSSNPIRDALRVANAWLFAAPVKVGDAWTEEINQGARDVEVVEVKKLRYRIEYEMPKAGLMGAWRTGTLIGKLLYA